MCALEQTYEYPKLGYGFQGNIFHPVKKSITSKDYKALVGLLQSRREARGILQSELAEKLKVPQSFISKYENFERRLDVIEVRTICHALGIDFAEFIAELEKLLRKTKK